MLVGEDSMNLAARVDSGDSRPASSVAPRCTVFLAVKVKPAECVAPCGLNSASRASSSVFFFSASLVAAAAASVSSLYLRSSSKLLVQKVSPPQKILRFSWSVFVAPWIEFDGTHLQPKVGSDATVAPEAGRPEWCRCDRWCFLGCWPNKGVNGPGCYTVVKVDGGTPKRWLSKGPW